MTDAADMPDMPTIPGVTFSKLSPNLGIDVSGLQVADGLGGNTFAALRQAWLGAGGFMVLRDQALSPEDHIAFSRRFGPLFGDAMPLQDTVSRYIHPDYPEIYRVSNMVKDGEALGRARAGTYWHSDVSFRARPALASLLYAIEIPPLGGDTLFADMAAAHDALSPAMQEMLSPLTAIHDFAVAAASQYAKPIVVDGDLDGANRSEHPVVITHPETGRRCLFVNPGFTSHLSGFHADESHALLNHLYGHATRPEFIYRHRWRANDLVIWDNRALMHYAVADYTADRYMHRTTVIAERPTA